MQDDCPAESGLPHYFLARNREKLIAELSAWLPADPVNRAKYADVIERR